MVTSKQQYQTQQHHTHTFNASASAIIDKMISPTNQNKSGCTGGELYRNVVSGGRQSIANEIDTDNGKRLPISEDNVLHINTMDISEGKGGGVELIWHRVTNSSNDTTVCSSGNTEIAGYNADNQPDDSKEEMKNIVGTSSSSTVLFEGGHQTEHPKMKQKSKKHKFEMKEEKVKVPDEQQKKARFQKLQDDLIWKMTGIDNTRGRVAKNVNATVVVAHSDQAFSFDAALAAHTEVTFNLVAESAGRGEASVPIAPLTAVRSSTLRLLTFANVRENQGRTVNDLISQIQHAEQAAMQQHINYAEDEKVAFI